jgi:hypothetical protein
MNSPAGAPQGPKRTPLPNPLPVRRGEGEATPRSLSALIQRQCGLGLALGTRLCPRAKTMKHTRSGALGPLANGVGCCQQDPPGSPRGHTRASP